MNVIVNISSTKFSLNGIKYFKNFTPHVLAGTGQLRIVNVYDSTLELVPFSSYSEFSVNGITCASAALLQDLLLPVLFARSSSGGGDPILQGLFGKRYIARFNTALDLTPQNVVYDNYTGITLTNPSSGKFVFNKTGGFNASGKTRVVTPVAYMLDSNEMKIQVNIPSPDQIILKVTVNGEPYNTLFGMVEINEYL